MREISLTRGFVALVDDEDYEALARFSWCAVRFSGKTLYALRSVRLNPHRTKNFVMHRELMNPTAGALVDHANGDGLDNRRANLRLATRAQNMQNRRIQSGSSRFKGVSWDDGSWRSYISCNGTRMWLGNFADEENAARAYDERARELFGPFAALNFPNPGEQGARRSEPIGARTT